MHKIDDMDLNWSEEDDKYDDDRTFSVNNDNNMGRYGVVTSCNSNKHLQCFWNESGRICEQELTMHKSSKLRRITAGKTLL